MQRDNLLSWKGVAAFAAMLFIYAAGPAQAQVTLGPLGQFAVVSDAGALSLGNSALVKGAGANVGATYNPITIGGNNSHIDGDVVTSRFELAPPGSQITLENYAHVLGACVTDAGGSVTLNVGANCASIDTSGSNSDINLLAGAVNQEEVVDETVLCQAPSQTLAAINLAASKSMKITDSVSGGLNVIDTPNITLGNSSVLTISGGASDTVVLETEGNITLGYGAKIVLAGGLKPNNVWITATAEPYETTGNPGPNGVLHLNNSSVVYGTMHGGNICTLGSGVTVYGAIVCDFGITTGPNLRVFFQPATGLSLPACSSPG